MKKIAILSMLFFITTGCSESKNDHYEPDPPQFSPNVSGEWSGNIPVSSDSPVRATSAVFSMTIFRHYDVDFTGDAYFEYSAQRPVSDTWYTVRKCDYKIKGTRLTDSRASAVFESPNDAQKGNGKCPDNQTWLFDIQGEDKMKITNESTHQVIELVGKPSY